MSQSPELSPPPSLLRASDADRDATAERLRVAYAEGRLGDLELDERLERALDARTVAQLAPLTSDLPSTSAQPRVQAGRMRTAPLRAAWTAWFLAVAVNLIIWAVVCIVSREWVSFWPAWVAGPWGVVLLSRTVASNPRSRSRYVAG